MALVSADRPTEDEGLPPVAPSRPHDFWAATRPPRRFHRGDKSAAAGGLRPPPILLPLGPMSRFLLILRCDANADLTKLAPAELAAQLGAYHHWATGLGARLIRTAELNAGALRRVAPQGTTATAARDPEAVSSVYEVEADDLDHAAALCDGHPGLRFGSIEVRAIQPDPDAPAEA